jgi:hypothetical protein
MALKSLNRIAWEYSADNGLTYRVAAQKALTDQAKLGGQAWQGVVGPLPRGYKMRRITCRNATNSISRVFPVYGTDADILVAGETIDANHLADSLTFTSDGNPISENRPRHSVTRQAN